MKYLIVKCEELGDQFECDADRTPMYMTDDWKNNYPKDYRFEVWELLKTGTFECIKSYEDSMEKGMFFGYYDYENHDELVILKKYPNKTRNEKCPKDIMKILKSKDTFDDSLKSCGYITGFNDNENFYVYGTYEDNNYSDGY
jgi:hypothetical protein